jgi:hypothetical protein
LEVRVRTVVRGERRVPWSTSAAWSRQKHGHARLSENATDAVGTANCQSKQCLPLTYKMASGKHDAVLSRCMGDA